jgi:hypothetical protein
MGLVMVAAKRSRRLVAEPAGSYRECGQNPLHAIHNLDCTIIFARDLAAMRRFYGETMAFTSIASSERAGRSTASAAPCSP